MILPALGDRDPHAVARGEVRKLLDDVAEGKGTIGEGSKARRLHDVRRTVSQRIAEEFGEGMSHSILGHARQRLGRIYIPNRPLKEQRDGLQWWSAELGRLVSAEKGEPAHRKDKTRSL